jgi:hypothetical protein
MEDMPPGSAAKIENRLSATLGEQVSQMWHVIMGMRENNPLTREDGILDSRIALHYTFRSVWSFE